MYIIILLDPSDELYKLLVELGPIDTTIRVSSQYCTVQTNTTSLTHMYISGRIQDIVPMLTILTVVRQCSSLRWQAALTQLGRAIEQEQQRLIAETRRPHAAYPA